MLNEGMRSMFEKGSCRRCGFSLTDVHEDGTSDDVRKTCPECRWINIPAGRHIDVNLARAASDAPAIFAGVIPPGDEADRAATLRCVKLWRQNAEDRIAEAVEHQPRQANSWLYAMLVDLPEGDKAIAGRSTHVISIQQVYLQLLRSHGVSAFHRPVPDLGPFWGAEIFSLGPLWQLLLECEREARLGRLPEVVDGHLVLWNDDPWSGEVNANYFRAPVDSKVIIDQYADPLVAEAERLAFGVSVVDLVSALGDVDTLATRTRVQVNDELLIVDLGPETPADLSGLCRRFMLTEDRLGRQEAPTFLCPADATVSQSAAELVNERSVFEWLTYAPLMMSIYTHDGIDLPAALTTRYLLYRTRGHAGVHVAQRLAAATQEAKRQEDQDKIKEVNRLARAFHGGFEERVGGALEAAGMTTHVGLDALSGQRLACGEIDALAVSRTAYGRQLVLVCEAKNTDLSFYVDLGPEQARETAEKSRRQAATKASWIAERWAEVGPSLAGDAASDPMVVAVTVPRVMALPLGGSGPASVPLPDLELVANRMQIFPMNQWRPDLRAAAVLGSRASTHSGEY